MSPDALQTARNLGKAYYEQGNYKLALPQFLKVVASGRALVTDYLDLGLAQMQVSQYDAALGSLTTAKQMDTSLLSADFNLGILYKRELRYPDAEAALARVAEADPADPAAWFNLGAVQVSQQKYEPALASYDHVLQMGFERARNFYVVSLFHTFYALLRLKRTDEAQKFLALHQKYRDRIPPISVEMVALEGGTYGAVLVPPFTAPPAESARRPARFVDVTTGTGLPSRVGAGAQIVIGDYDGDGKPDIFVASAAGDRLYRNGGTGGFADVTERAGVHGASNCALFADYDNSGHTSLLTGGPGGLKLYHNTGGEHLTDATAGAGLQLPSGETVSALVPVDADNDGLLDLYVGVEGSAGHLLRNSGDGTFRDITAAAGLSGAVDVRQALVSDLDNDGFLDLVLMRGSAPPLVYVNQGGAQFADRSARAGLPTASSIFAVDLDHDGNFDLVLWTATGPAAFHNRGDASFSRVALPEYAGARAGVVADVDGDGFDDLLFAGADGQWHLLANRGGSFREEPVQVPAGVAPIHAAAAWLNRPRDLDLIQTDAEGALAVWRRQPPESGWIEVALQGAKSNAQGVGAVVEIKAGNFYQKVMATGGPVRVFTGSLPKVDVVRVTWPNALVQNVVNSATGKRVAVRESERMASSCPFVYAWNGTEYEFVTDVLGASPLGELAPDGTLLAPNSREYVRLPAWIQPRNGLYTFQFTSEMREVDYFDGAHLVAVDHAAGEEIYANEIYASTPTAPALYRVRDRHAPAAATTDGDRDVLPPLTRRDGHYVGGFRRTRIPGMAELHELTIDLGSAARAPHVSLWLTGWVFWPDSNSARALSAQKTHMVGPYLQVRDAQGRWVTVIEDMGLPSGTNRSLRVDLTGKFLSEDRQVRIVTNLCVYWDEAFFATDEEALRPFAEVLPAHADLHYRGFATPESDPGGVRPDHLEYARLDAEVPWNPAAGRYTRYGNVQRLVTAPDDRIVVMAPGDELTVSFPASSLPPPAPGRQRQWFLLLDGWAKDNEPNTVTGNTSGPLPYRAMKSYPYSRDEALGREAYVRQYQTRPRRAWIPPLAPLAGANTR